MSLRVPFAGGIIVIVIGSCFLTRGGCWKVSTFPWRSMPEARLPGESTFVVRPGARAAQVEAALQHSRLRAAVDGEHDPARGLQVSLDLDAHAAPRREVHIEEVVLRVLGTRHAGELLHHGSRGIDAVEASFRLVGERQEPLRGRDLQSQIGRRSAGTGTLSGDRRETLVTSSLGFRLDRLRDLFAPLARPIRTSLGAARSRCADRAAEHGRDPAGLGRGHNMKSFALSFLSADEAPLTARVGEVFEIYPAVYGDGEAVVKRSMLLMLWRVAQASRPWRTREWREAGERGGGRPGFRCRWTCPCLEASAFAARRSQQPRRGVPASDPLPAAASSASYTAIVFTLADNTAPDEAPRAVHGEPLRLVQ